MVRNPLKRKPRYEGEKRPTVTVDSEGSWRCSGLNKCAGVRFDPERVMPQCEEKMCESYDDNAQRGDKVFKIKRKEFKSEELARLRRRAKIQNAIEKQRDIYKSGPPGDLGDINQNYSHYMVSFEDGKVVVYARSEKHAAHAVTDRMHVQVTNVRKITDEKHLERLVNLMNTRANQGELWYDAHNDW